MPFSYRCENLIYNYDKNLFLIEVFQISVGAWAPTSYYVASSLATKVKTQKTEVGVVNATMAPRRKYRGLNVFPTKRFNMGQSFKL